MLKQRIKKIEKQVRGPNYYSKKRIEAMYKYLLTGDESCDENLGEINAAEIYLALEKAREKAKEIGIENVKGLKAIQEKTDKESKGCRKEKKK